MYFYVYTPSNQHFKAFLVSKSNSETSFLYQLFKENSNFIVTEPCKVICKSIFFNFHYYLYLFIYLLMYFYTPRGTMMSRIRKKTHQPGHYPKFHVEIRNYFVKWICQSCTSVCVARLSAVPQKTVRRELEEFFRYRA